MNFTDKCILEYCENFAFRYSEHISTRVFNVEIDIDIFEYKEQHNYREKAHVAFKTGDLTYECDCCDEHNYENDFYPIILNNQRLICFRKTLYGFTLINADTLTVEFEYFPEKVFNDEESFIIVNVKQLENLLIFEGCYWACPYECFAFDYEKKLFLNISKLCSVFFLDKTEVKDNKLTICGTDKSNLNKQIALSIQDIISAMDKHGNPNF